MFKFFQMSECLSLVRDNRRVARLPAGSLLHECANTICNHVALHSGQRIIASFPEKRQIAAPAARLTPGGRSATIMPVQ